MNRNTLTLVTLTLLLGLGLGGAGLLPTPLMPLVALPCRPRQLPP